MSFKKRVQEQINDTLKLRPLAQSSLIMFSKGKKYVFITILEHGLNKSGKKFCRDLEDAGFKIKVKALDWMEDKKGKKVLGVFARESKANKR